MKKFYLVAAVIAVMMMFVGCDTEQNGRNGRNGKDGISIVWKGSLAAAPNNPETNWAYYNTADKKSYIYDGTEWQILAQDGQDVTADVHIPSYTIIFAANGGTGYMPKMVCEIGQTYDVPECEFTAPARMGFKCWDLFGDESTFSNLSTTDGDILVMTAQWGRLNYIAANGNMVINQKECAKTSMKQVLSESTTITCDQSNGVFPTGRGSVTLGKYAIGNYPVTQELYTAVMGNNPSYFNVSRVGLDTTQDISESDTLLRPVEKVCWYDAVVFCNKLSLLMDKTRCYKLKDGSYPEDNMASIPTDNSTNIENWHDMICDWTADGYRLPTECEWECAARGGTYSAGTPWTYTYSGSNTVGDVAWYLDNSNSHTWEVGLKDPNSLGLYDMSGNVWEWCWDNYNTAAIDGSTPATGPATNSSSLFNRRQRGGSWFSNASNCEVSNRDYCYPYDRYNNLGFRISCLQF
ncbi:MAG: SUMF1/EgtB/PvdO family nonheme iron enzyme [Spirochaetales bacterium]|nr:SUMF1/EgtB/PvdO family nonheme iron enzyme [Spirochaetales bacterium]